MVKRRTVWDDAAKMQFREIIQYIKIDSLQNAEKVKREILQSSRELAKYPEKFSPDKYKKRNYNLSYRAFELHKIRISYKVEPDLISVVRCRHTKQKPLFY